MKTQKQQEIEEQLKQTQADIDAQVESEEPQEDILEDSPEEIETQQEELVDEVDGVGSEPEQETKPQEDYKKRYVESTREAQRLYKNNVKVREAIEEANSIAPPSDEEMTREYPEWDIMSEVEQKLARENLVNKRKFDLLHTASQVTKNIEDWNIKVDQYLDDPKTLIEYPELEGKQDDFKVYSTGKEGIGTNFDILVGAFLHSIERNAAPKKKGKMMEVGTGGPNEKPSAKGDKITLEEANKLMRTDYKEYKKYLLAGRIDTNL